MRLLAALLVMTPLVASCGSGEDTTEPECLMPGTLQALAVQGTPAPGTVGDFSPFPTAVPMDVANGGLSLFVADTTDATRTSVVYAVEANATLHVVYAVGDTPPGVVGETFTAFLPLPLRIAADGRILCGATLSGGRTGLFTALLSAGAVTDRATVVLTGANMAGTGLAGTLTTIDGDDCHLAEGGKVFFEGETSSALEGFWRADPDGTNLDLLVGEGDSVQGGETVEGLGRTGISEDGGRFAFEAVLVGSPDAGVYSAAPADPVASELAREGDPVPGGGNIQDVFEGPQLLVYASGAVVWEGDIIAGMLNLETIFLGAPGLPVAVLAVEGDPAPQTNVDYGDISQLRSPPDATSPMWKADLDGANPANDVAIFAESPVGVVLVTFENRPSPAGSTFGEVFPGLTDAGRRPVSKDGSLVFANILSDARSGVFWLIPNCGLFTVALSGRTVLATDQFLGFGPAAGQTSANGVVLFRAPLANAGSAIFRQGP